LLTESESASFTCAVKLYTPATSDVPLISPVERFKLMLGGGDPPTTVQVPYGAVPPAALRVVEYAVPAVAFGRGEEVEIDNTFVTVTIFENPLSSLPEAVAFAFTCWPNVSAVRPVFVHAPDDTVVVPTDDPSTYTSMLVPSASELVPDAEVAPTLIGALTTGAAVKACTVTVFENGLRLHHRASFCYRLSRREGGESRFRPCFDVTVVESSGRYLYR
jgi:hypothetical protein